MVVELGGVLVVDGVIWRFRKVYGRSKGCKGLFVDFFIILRDFF